MNSFLFKMRPSGKEWVILGLSSGAFILAVLACVGTLFSLGTFFVQKELPWQSRTAWFSESSVNASSANNASSVENMDQKDQIAVLQVELEALKASVLKNNSTGLVGGGVAAQNLTAVPLQLAKMDLHLALAELTQGGDLNLALGFLKTAQQELLAAHCLLESQLLAPLITQIQANNSPNRVASNSQNNINFLIKNLGALSFNLPVNIQDINTQDLNTQNLTHKNNPKNNPSPNIWESGLEQSWNRIQGLLIIRENQTVGEFLLLDSTREALLASVIFELQDAQGLSHSGQWGAYDQALAQIESQVTLNFQDNAQRQAWLNKLQSLRQAPEIAMQAAIKNSVIKILEVLNQNSPGNNAENNTGVSA